MDTWILVGLILIILVILAPILAMIAMNRTTKMQYQIDQLNQKIIILENQVSQENLSSLAQSKIQSESHKLTPNIEPQPSVIVIPSEIQEILPQPIAAISTQSPVMVIPTSASIKATQNVNPNRFDKSVENQDSSDNKSLFSHFFTWLVTGNPLAKIGILLLFLGVAYLLSYSVQNDIISPELRLVMSAVGCLVLLGIGWWVRTKKALFGLILQGGAIGCLYITIFAAFKLYTMIPYGFAFVAMLVICAASIALALLQRTISLAILASLGGYLAPILLSTGGGSHIILFSYYLMLSTGILIISGWQAWRPLNLVGMFMTYGVAVLWGLDNYIDDYYLSCQIFIIANLIIFNLLTQLFALRFDHSKQLVVDNTLLFFPPLMSIGMQFFISDGLGFIPAFISLFLGLLYLLVGLRLHKRYQASGKNMALANMVIGTGFVTAAIPLALSFTWTSIIWSVEGLLLLWFALRQGHQKMALGASLLIIVSAVMVLSDYPYFYWDDSHIYMMPGLIAACICAGGLFHLRRQEENYFSMMSYGLLVLGLLIWFIWVPELSTLLSWNSETESLIILALVLISSWCWRLFALRINWTPLLLCQFFLWIVAYYYLSIDFYFDINPMGRGEGSLIWPVILGSSILSVLYAYKIRNLLIQRMTHIANLWLIIIFGLTQVNWFVVILPWGMSELGYFIYIMAITLLVLVLYWLQNHKFAPMRRHGALYWYSLLPLMAGLTALSCWSNMEDGKLTYWSYIPLINPLDEAGLFSIATILLMRKGLMEKIKKVTAINSIITQGLLFVIIGLSVIWYNGIILRATADFADLMWNRYVLYDSRLIQTVLSISWAAAALVCMVIAALQKSRAWWVAGAVIFACVIAKLFLIDIYGQDGISRAVSFIAVAVLILVVGYFSPLPPKDKTEIVEKETQA